MVFIIFIHVSCNNKVKSKIVIRIKMNEKQIRAANEGIKHPCMCACHDKTGKHNNEVIGAKVNKQ